MIRFKKLGGEIKMSMNVVIEKLISVAMSEVG